MKKIFFLAFIFFISKTFSQVNVRINFLTHPVSDKGSVIYYHPAQKLNWSDFRGYPQNEDNTIAVTSSGFGYSQSSQIYSGQLDLEISVYCYFDKNKSWVVNNLSSDYALTHEQHHFDISFIAANIFVQKLRAAKFNARNFNAVIERIYNESGNLMKRMQAEYDGQTSHGRIKNMQAFWNAKIDNELKGQVFFVKSE